MREFKKQFSSICTSVPKAKKGNFKIYYPKNLIENSAFFNSVVTGTDVQSVEFIEMDSAFETADKSVAKRKNTDGTE